jgi:cell division protein FtsB
MKDIEKKIQCRREESPSIEQLKDMVSQLAKENEMLRSANAALNRACNTLKDNVNYAIEICRLHEETIAHEIRMKEMAESKGDNLP